VPSSHRLTKKTCNKLLKTTKNIYLKIKTSNFDVIASNKSRREMAP
jgi:hypothetical protein